MTFSDSQITKEDKDWLYPQMIQTIKKVERFYYCCLFSYKTVRFSELRVRIRNDEWLACVKIYQI